MSHLLNEVNPIPSGIVAPHKKEGQFNIIQALRFIDESVIGTYNKLCRDDGRPEKCMDCMPFKSDYIEKLTTENPDEGQPVRLVTYRIRRAEPGSMTGGTKDRKWRLRESVSDPSNINLSTGNPEVSDIYGKWVDYTVRFDCFAPTWLETQTLALDFEDLLDLATDYITSKGLVKFINMGRNADIYHQKTQYYYEAFHYMFRIEKLKVEEGPTFQRFYTYLDEALMQVVKP
jgi:hypothetical protein